MPGTHPPSTHRAPQPHPETDTWAGGCRLAYHEFMTDAGSLRVGHGEREHVVMVLTQQYAEGRLTAEELERLSVEARAARTFAGLDLLVADLPVLPPSVELRRVSTTTDISLLGADPAHRLHLSAGMSSHVRRGVWTVPPYLSISAGIATVKLDFQRALCHHAVVDIAINAGLGAVVLVVPEGWGANTDQVSKGMGSVSNRVDGVPEPGKPLLVIHGSPAVGSLRVRYAGWHDKRLMRQAMRRTTAVEGGASKAGFSGAKVRPFPSSWPSSPQDAPLLPRDRADGSG